MMEEKFMQRCIDLAKLGAGNVASNPMVGCVIVLDGKIIGEGFHEKFGEAHAEVNAICSVKNEELLSKSTLYVNLEPCSHFGKTPPCTNLIIEKRIPEVIIGCIDPNPLVSGDGIRKLLAANCKLEVGILEDECRKLNKRFFTFIEKKRPYIILKWAQTADHFLAPLNKQRTNISNEFSRVLAQRWRSEEQAVMIGTETAFNDNPKLDARHWNNRNPVRIVLDRTLRLSPTLEIFNGKVRTILFTERKFVTNPNAEYVCIDFSKNIIPQISDSLYEMNIQSVLVEGGAQLLQSFLHANLWDEARVFTSNQFLKSGIDAPKVSGTILEETAIGEDRLMILRNE